VVAEEAAEVVETVEVVTKIVLRLLSKTMIETTHVINKSSNLTNTTISRAITGDKRETRIRSINLTKENKLYSKKMLGSLVERLKEVKAVNKPTRILGQHPNSLEMLRRIKSCVMKELSLVRKIMVSVTEKTKLLLSITTRIS